MEYVLYSRDVSTHRGRSRPEQLPFEPPPHTAVHRWYRVKRDHPTLYATRHVLAGIGEALVALVGLAFLVRWVPWGAIPTPSVDLPDQPLPDLPDIPLPHVSLPDWRLPGWLRAVARTKEYWLPIVIGIALAGGEMGRRRRRQGDRAAGPGPGPGDAGRAG